MINQIFDSDSFKIISLFSLSPGSAFKRNEIKEKTKLNNVPLDKTLLKLLYSGILKKENNLYKIDFRNEYAKKLIDISSGQYKDLKELPFDVYLLLSDLTLKLSTIKYIEAYLFGSYSKLIYNEKSDVDIAILTPKIFDKKNVLKIIRKPERVYGKIIEVHFFEKKSFYENKKDPLVKEIIKNGMRII